MSLTLFDDICKGYLMTTVSIFGLVCNSLTIYILNDKDVKLAREFVQSLCSLTIFDNSFLICSFFLFSLPNLSAGFSEHQFPYIAPYLFPITSTLMTCSCYMTVAVSVNRCIGTISSTPARSMPPTNNGYIQSLIVLVASAAVNAPRWMEFSCCTQESMIVNITDSLTGKITIVNTTIMAPITNPMRDKYEYVLYYTLITSNVLTLLLPMILLLISAVLIYNEMARTANLTAGLLSDAEETSRRRRYQSVTFMLIGIIILFIFCRIGELLITIYELIMLVLNGERVSFHASARAIISFNHFLLVCNSSLNFAIYCKDVFFRQCLLKLYHALRGQKQSSGNLSAQETQVFRPKFFKDDAMWYCYLPSNH